MFFLSGLQQVMSDSINPLQIRKCNFLIPQLISISPLNYPQNFERVLAQNSDYSWSESSAWDDLGVGCDQLKKNFM